MADAFYSTDVYCNECDTQLMLVDCNGRYLHHEKVAGCSMSNMYFFPPKVSLDEAWSLNTEDES